MIISQYLNYLYQDTNFIITLNNFMLNFYLVSDQDLVLHENDIFLNSMLAMMIYILIFAFFMINSLFFLNILSYTKIT
jgi:hypothetical protein